MPFRIFQIADVHIGMKFSNYPDELRLQLIEARFQALERAVREANGRQADLFVIAGDLFESFRVGERDKKRVRELLNHFEGEEVLILPGNHDYYDPNMGFWEEFSEKLPDHVRVLKYCQKYECQAGGHQAAIFAAPCDKRHSEKNRLDFVKTAQLDPAVINVLIAHGSIESLSLDAENRYFPMTLPELESLGMDLCLTGHTHVPYPQEGEQQQIRIFNPGTPEPDGMNYRYDGSGFYIEIDPDKKIRYEHVKLGRFRFFDEGYFYQSEKSIEEAGIEICERYRDYDPKRVLVRLNFSGYMEKEDFEERMRLFEALKKYFAYFDPVDKNLKVRFTESVLEKEFVKNSLPYLFLKKVLEREDENTAHLAYEMVKEVLKNA